MTPHSTPAQLGFELPERPWPSYARFPYNFQERRVGPRLLSDLADARDPLVITGYGGLEQLVGLFRAWELRRTDGSPLSRVRVLVGSEPAQPRRPLASLAETRVQAAISDYWLERGISLLQCRELLSAIALLESGIVAVRSSAGSRVHAKMYIGDHAATIGSSNYTEPGLSRNLEANVRFEQDLEPERFAEARDLAERIWDEGGDFTEGFRSLLEQLLSKVTWQEALARASAEILEGDWTPVASGKEGSSLWPSQEQGIAQALWVLENVGSVLLADATGSGKTRTGAHLIAALQERNWRTGKRRSRQPVLICPPTLEQPWRDEISAAGESVTVFSHGILGRDRARREAELRAALRGTEVLAVDEAHNFLNRLSNRARALLGNTADHVILLTATPINRGATDLLAIVDLLGADNFDDDVLDVVARLGGGRGARVMTPSDRERIRVALQKFVVRRTKTDLNGLIDREPARYVNARGHACRFPEHAPVVYERTDPQEDQARALAIRMKAKNLRGLVNLRSRLRLPLAYRIEGKTEEQFLAMRLGGARALAAYQLRSRLRSSKVALIEHILGTEEALERFGIEGGKSARSGNLIARLEEIRGRPPKIELDVEVPEWLRDADAHARVVDEEIETYRGILEQAEHMSEHRADDNARYLLEAVGRHDRILAFDSHPISLLDLEKRLRASGANPVVATGEMDTSARLAFSRRFGLGAEERGLIGLCSDALAEGLNLQGASAMVHLDMPTVIRVLEQRIGRVDRMDSPHSRIEVHWPKEPRAFQLRSDERLFLRLRDVDDLIRSNVPVPAEFETYETEEGDYLELEEIIEVVERGEGPESRVTLLDAFARVRSLVSGPTALIPEGVYGRLRDTKVRVLSSVSVVPAETPWVFLAVGASDRSVPRWVFVDGLLDEEPAVEGTLERVAAALADRLAEPSGDLPFDERAAEMLSGALEAAERHQRTLLPTRKQRALAEMGQILKRYSVMARKAGDSRRQRLVDGITAHLDDAQIASDLEPLAEWWLALIRPEWYAHLTRPRIRRPARLQHIRRALHKAPISTERLATVREVDLAVVPLERRVAAAIVGVPAEL